MTFRAFVVCEDHTLDQYVAVPVVRAALAELGKTRAAVKAVTNPRLTGISSVETQFAEIAERYAAIGDLVVFSLDLDKLDGKGGRGDRQAGFSFRLGELPAKVREKTAVVLARQELEVWALWGSRSDLQASWADVREERDSKERFFDPLVTKVDLQQPGAGRTRLVEKSLSSGWASLSAGCPELASLYSDLKTILQR